MEQLTDSKLEKKKIGKGVPQGCILSPYFFNLYADYIMQNAMEESHPWIPNWN